MPTADRARTSHAAHSVRRVGAGIGLGLAIAVLVLLLLEGGLRIAGRPDGRFAFTLVNRPGMYEPNADFVASWGDFPYRIVTNSRGLRSPEPRQPKPRWRIVALGDSITDGFFVDDGDTYPAQMQRALSAAHIDADVQNVAHGQASIDKELGSLRRVGLALDPDIVVLTFVTNDLAELRGKTPAELRDGTLGLKELHISAQRWLITRTALGEALFDTLLRRRTVRYDRHLDASHIVGNADYDDNVRRFRAYTSRLETATLRTPSDPEIVELLRVYLSLFDELVQACRQRHIQPVLVYFPAYSQVYGTDDSFAVRDQLRGEADRLQIPFIDLTVAFRSARPTGPLHLAPVDFHPNRAGYALIGQTVAQSLLALKLVQ